MLQKLHKLLILPILVLFFTSTLYALPIAGTSSGVFNNPTGPSGMVTTGVGTNTFTWGTSNAPSSLTFTGDLFSTETDDIFSIGTLSYFNGSIQYNTHAEDVDLNITLSFSTPSGIEQDFMYNLGLINTINYSDPYASADYVYLSNTVPDTFFTANGVNYTLEFLGFGKIVGSGFTTIDNFHVLENCRASAELFGRITEHTDTEPVPEPATMLLFGTGLVGLARFKKKFNK